LAIVYRRSHVLACQLGDVDDRILVAVTVCGQVSKIRDACDETAVVLVIDHRPVPNSVHAYLYGQPGKMKTDKEVAAIEARATTANMTMPAKGERSLPRPPPHGAGLVLTTAAGALRGG
jgi:hypothetical protein